jgi:hypothetical protein
MWKAAVAGLVLATMGATWGSAQEYQAASYESGSASRGPVVTSGHIARLKAALKLTAAQMHYWPAVENALRGLAQRHGRDHGADGMMRRVAAAAVDANALRRVVSAARPLIKSLDDQQKQDGMQVINSLGFSSLASAL